jgi:hypothetical protein
MDFPPPNQQTLSLFDHDLHGPPDRASLHSVDPNQLGRAIRAGKIDLGMTIAEHMDMCGLVVVDKMTMLRPWARWTVTMAISNLS